MDSAERVPRLTVAIPLYRAAAWLDTVLANLGAIPDDVVILLSEDADSDGSAERIRAQVPDDRRIHYRQNPGPAGWRGHCNALIEACQTEYFSLLPQDDLLGPDYHARLVAALDAHPWAVIAFGSLIAEGGPFKRQTRFASPPMALGQRAPWQEAIDLEAGWNLGVPFRGVIRRSALRPIPPAPGDQFADQLWIFSMALAGHLIEVPDARYFKRYHAGNTHGQWQAPGLEERRRQLEDLITRHIEDETLRPRVLAYLNQVSWSKPYRRYKSLGIC